MRISIVQVVALVSVAVMLTVWGAVDTITGVQLDAQAQRVEARVSDWRITRSRRSHSYKVDCEFDLGDVTYQVSPILGLSLSEAEWNRTRSTRTLSIAYVPAHPWMNRVWQTGSYRSHEQRAWAVIALFIGIAAIALLAYRHSCARRS